MGQRKDLKAAAKKAVGIEKANKAADKDGDITDDAGKQDTRHWADEDKMDVEGAALESPSYRKHEGQGQSELETTKDSSTGEPILARHRLGSAAKTAIAAEQGGEESESMNFDFAANKQWEGAGGYQYSYEPGPNGYAGRITVTNTNTGKVVSVAPDSKFWAAIMGEYAKGGTKDIQATAPGDLIGTSAPEEPGVGPTGEPPPEEAGAEWDPLPQSDPDDIGRSGSTPDEWVPRQDLQEPPAPGHEGEGTLDDYLGTQTPGTTKPSPGDLIGERPHPGMPSFNSRVRHRFEPQPWRPEAEEG